MSLDLEPSCTRSSTAPALTGALGRQGSITALDETGAPRDFVTSAIAGEAHLRFEEWPDGPRLFEHFHDLPRPLRLADVPAHVPSLGFASERLPSKTFQGTPMRHRSVHVGNVYLVEKEGGEEFADEDEEVLRPFASQAASAIASACTCRDERRARADLEAGVETSPVGVAARSPTGTV